MGPTLSALTSIDLLWRVWTVVWAAHATILPIERCTIAKMARALVVCVRVSARRVDKNDFGKGY